MKKNALRLAVLALVIISTATALSACGKRPVSLERPSPTSAAQ